jgi:hypothetical protein
MFENLYYAKSYCIKRIKEIDEKIRSLFREKKELENKLQYLSQQEKRGFNVKKEW